MMTREENEVVNALVNAYNRFVKLPELHPADAGEFTTAFHAAQNIVMSRPVMRELQEQTQPTQAVNANRCNHEWYMHHDGKSFVCRKCKKVDRG